MQRTGDLRLKSQILSHGEATSLAKDWRAHGQFLMLETEHFVPKPWPERGDIYAPLIVQVDRKPERPRDPKAYFIAVFGICLSKPLSRVRYDLPVDLNLCTIAINLNRALAHTSIIKSKCGAASNKLT